MPLKLACKLLLVLISATQISGCWYQLKHGPQYVHPVQPSYDYVLTEPLTIIYGEHTALSGWIEVNAALSPDGKEYLQIKQNARHGTPSTMLYPNTVNSRRDLAGLFNKAYTLLSQAKELGMEFKYRSLGCLGPQHNEPNCRDNGAAFFGGQMHLSVQSNGLPIAYFRAVESQHHRGCIDQLQIFNIEQLKKMQIAMDKAPMVFEQLRNKHKGWLAKQSF